MLVYAVISNNHDDNPTIELYDSKKAAEDRFRYHLAHNTKLLDNALCMDYMARSYDDCVAELKYEARDDNYDLYVEELQIRK